ncbi:hypothetical protein RM717_04575 [Streptomyces griseus]|uniref:Uncharacterized protein n=1 Tax=Streptomyces stephensoniae TaxID=3375367 RepID=A0ABU2VWX8_9ACTN|nr:hypothetical protein [Streptomyces griseus]MDT0489775.1 hypothetical protein [Streptomyces griseus]
MGTDSSSTMDMKLAAADGPARITFEPGGTAFTLAAEEFLTLRLEPDVVPAVEITVWPNGISVWLPYPGESDYIVLDSEGREVARLW